VDVWKRPRVFEVRLSEKKRQGIYALIARKKLETFSALLTLPRQRLAPPRKGQTP
jgi:hypothetical protein